MTQPESSTGDAEQPVRTNEADDDEADELLTYAYLRPGIFSLYPRFDPATVRNILESLGQQWNEDHYLRELHQYNRARRQVGFLNISGVLFLCIVVATILTSATQMKIQGMSDDDIFAKFAPKIATMAGLYLAGIIFWCWPIGNANVRFFRRIGDAIQPVWKAGQDRSLAIEVLYVLNKLGAASRALFLVLQGSRRTWKSPPMVADRASTLASVLIDFDIPNDLHLKNSTSRESLHRFLQDAAAVVAIGREDLLSRVRERYRELPLRSEEDESKRQRDVTYLNAMRDRSRWDVAKDFWYPLAPWLSLIVATAALVISIRR